MLKLREEPLSVEKNRLQGSSGDSEVTSLLRNAIKEAPAMLLIVFQD